MKESETHNEADGDGHLVTQQLDGIAEGVLIAANVTTKLPGPLQRRVKIVALP